MPEDLRTVITRIVAYLEQQVQLAKRAVENDEYETLDFLLGNIAQAAVRARAAISNQLRFLREQK